MAEECLKAASTLTPYKHIPVSITVANKLFNTHDTKRSFLKDLRLTEITQQCELSKAEV